jgi:hypothetical protein
MAYTAYLDTVQKMYIAYYQRPADPLGEIYWAQKLDAAGGNQSAIIATFSSSLESTALYGTITSANIGTVIDNIYTGLFGRAADSAGKAYYVSGFNAGTFTAGTIALNVLNGATGGNDLLSVNNKVTAAGTFTNAIDPGLDPQGTLQATYSGTADTTAALNWLASVTWNPGSIPSATQTTTFIQTSIANTGDPILTSGGQAFTLTTADDSCTGGSGNDTFTGTFSNGGTNTFNIGDILAGDGGTDTLNINPNIAGTAITLDDTFWTHVTDIENIMFSTTIAGVQTITTGNNFNTAFAAGVHLTTVSTDGAMNIAMGGTVAEAVTLTTNSTGGIQTIGTGSGSGLVTVNATSTSGGLNISGADITAVTTNSTSGIQTINTSTGTGAVTVNATSTSGALNITTGAGNDTITISSTAPGATINAGGGKDAITLGAGDTTIEAITVTPGDSTQAAFDAIANFGIGTGSGSDTLALGSTTLLTAGQLAGGGWSDAAGIATKAGSTLADFLTAATTSTTAGVVAYCNGIDTYVVASDGLASGAADTVVQLFGITTATAVANAVAATTIHIV